tara:strand:- start:6002 stop:6814 length:813 start_codon:yes stop_codon:yes gene_type:complete
MRQLEMETLRPKEEAMLRQAFIDPVMADNAAAAIDARARAQGSDMATGAQAREGIMRRREGSASLRKAAQAQGQAESQMILARQDKADRMRGGLMQAEENRNTRFRGSMFDGVVDAGMMVGSTMAAGDLQRQKEGLATGVEPDTWKDRRAANALDRAVLSDEEETDALGSFQGPTNIDDLPDSALPPGTDKRVVGMEERRTADPYDVDPAVEPRIGGEFTMRPETRTPAAARESLIAQGYPAASMTDMTDEQVLLVRNLAKYVDAYSEDH